VARFIGDFLAFAFLSVVTLFMGMGFVSLVSPILAIAILLPALIVGPIGIFIVSLVKARPGRIVGALAGVPLLLVFHQATIWQKASFVDSLNQREFLPAQKPHPQQEFLPAQKPHTVLVIQDATSSEVIRPDYCKTFCAQVIESAPYTVAFEEGKTRTWFAFRRGYGATCLEPGVINSYVVLLEHRFDFCPLRYELKPSPDALIIRHNSSSESRLRMGLPFHSMAFEFFERIDGNDRLLGRWVWSVPDPWAWSGPMGAPESPSNVKFTDAEFYFAALGLRINDPKGSAPLDKVLVALAPFFKEDDTLILGTHALGGLIRSASPEEMPLLRSYLDDRIAELEGMQPEGQRKTNMLLTLKRWRADLQ
jgi:hypothetical protein